MTHYYLKKKLSVKFKNGYYLCTWDTAQSIIKAPNRSKALSLFRSEINSLIRATNAH
jgi:hypothetical protein